MESKSELRPCGCDCATPCLNGKTGSDRLCWISNVDVSLAEPDNPKRAPTHRCKVCGAAWICKPPGEHTPPGYGFGSWSLASKQCGKCCDNVEMGAQIEALPPPKAILTEDDRWRIACGEEPIEPPVVVTKETLDTLPDEARERVGLPTAVDKALDQLSLEQRAELLESRCTYGSCNCFCVSHHRDHFVQLGLVNEHGRVISALGQAVRNRLRESIKLIAEDGSMTTQQRLAWAMESHPDRRTPEFMDAFKEAAAKLEAKAAEPEPDDLSFGERLVQYREDDPADVQRIKQHFAEILDHLNDLRQGYAREGATEQRGRLLSIAITEAEGACMWAVKGLTS